MKAKGLLVVFIILFYSAAALAQQSAEEKSAKNIVVNYDVATTFDKTLDFLQNNGYFIVSLDKQAGFIQSKIFIKKNRNLITGKIGERRTVNFLIRPLEENQSNVSIDIYIDEHYYLEEGYSYKDGGKSDDLELYKNILRNLQNSF